MCSPPVDSSSESLTLGTAVWECQSAPRPNVRGDRAHGRAQAQGRAGQGLTHTTRQLQGSSLGGEGEGQPPPPPRSQSSRGRARRSGLAAELSDPLPQVEGKLKHGGCQALVDEVPGQATLRGEQRKQYVSEGGTASQGKVEIPHRTPPKRCGDGPLQLGAAHRSGELLLSGSWIRGRN